jgi:hypothetical protein
LSISCSRAAPTRAFALAGEEAADLTSLTALREKLAATH